MAGPPAETAEIPPRDRPGRGKIFVGFAVRTGSRSEPYRSDEACMKNQLIASIAVGLLVVCTVSADDALPPEQIRAGEARQTQIKAQTQNVAAQLGAIIDEFRRNGLDGQDVEVLEAIRRVLGKLSDQEMKKVIDALQEARSQADPSQSKKAFAGAVSDQKAIIAQLRALLIEYQRQQALYELSLRLAALAERENANLKTVVDLAKMTGNATASR